MELNSLTQQSECAGAESGCLRIISEFLGDSSMRLGIPFITPRQLGAVGDKLGRPSLPSVEWRTGQSGAPPDNYYSLPVRDCLPNRAQTTVAALGPLAHRTLSGAHRTVRCPLPTVGAATCRSRIAWPTIGAGDRWLTGQSGAPPNSSVNYSRTPPLIPESGEFTRTGLVHRTLSGVPSRARVCCT
jgi:hypothetical protein